ncbi:hypothetical protein ACIO6U_02995 [Streptomyces sp. NPDC087422]|uniref:hypothetical protein n=1 Tax=Streptomyces sp. NPDC087422 TaxID=3365786 RepID=UPI00380BA2CD
MDTTTTLTAYQLSELIRKVEPHIGRHSGYGPIQGIRLDYDGRHLHAVATDRYTMAVARQRTRSNDPAWAHTLHADQVDALAAWLKANSADGNPHNVHLMPGEHDITFNGDRGNITLPAMGGPYPEWRGIFKKTMATPIGEAPYSRITAKLLGRWAAAGEQVSTWHAVASQPIIIVGNGFLGLQMPARFTGNDTARNIADDTATWAGSLGDAAPVEMDDTLNTYEPEELETRDNAIASDIEFLLKQTLRSSGDLFAAATNDPAALAAYALAGGRAWTAYRLVKALQQADPDLLRATLADTNEQLESGEIGEWAWDAAEKAGHDPQQWHDDYEAHLKKLADKKAAEASAA